MSTKSTHISIAAKNDKAKRYLLEKINDYPEWVTITAFYQALHMTEAVFAGDKKIKHSQSHDNRLANLKSDNRYSHLYKHFRPLYSASMVARYLSADNKEYSSFTEYLTPDEVLSEIINYRLCEIEKTVETLLKK